MEALEQEQILLQQQGSCLYSIVGYAFVASAETHALNIATAATLNTT